ncbi:MAG: phasin family protein [Gammaproteobacteria bacterium]|nr:phasin family protein [Gammaproteobacteria bacterium]NIR81976.1 phasin family protein [Gammaproteobacteria bacterium]NIR89028.1 phasin family protein [Gammaproteobacteria bacterium]NIU03083.1 phasin family protein [Gammaproteobacteria bacterium]NIV50607.1 poly granule associated protein [Gammaproteobacteria bacterium]
MADKPSGKSEKQQGAGGILDSAHEIWLAGVGAFTKAQKEGGKVFQSLVRTGREVESQREAAGKGSKEEARFELGEKIEEVRERAALSWDRFEHVIEERLSKALDRLGVPRRNDLEALSRRIERLEKTLKEFQKGGGGGTAGSAAKKHTTKTRTRTTKKRT